MIGHYDKLFKNPVLHFARMPFTLHLPSSLSLKLSSLCLQIINYLYLSSMAETITNTIKYLKY